jgi:hypothetical protein
MNWSTTVIGRIILTALSLVVIVVFLYVWLGRIRDKQSLMYRLAATGILFGFFFITAIPSFRAGGVGGVFGLFYAMIFGALMAIVWVPPVVGFFGDMVGSIYTGGNDAPDPKPLLSIFHAKRAKGQYFEALAEIRRQLDKFPEDYECMLLLAELQAENLDDLPGADVTIHRLCRQPGLAPANIASALSRLADWHLSLTKDREAAQRVLEEIITLLPDTEMSLKAAQRIAHLAGTEALLAPAQRQTISVKKGEQRLGLVRDQGRLKLKETDQGQVAADYVKHLEQHPFDTEVREKLAVVYAGHFHRLDLALDQLEQLVQQPNHPPKQVVHWLNLMADLQVREGAPLEGVRDTLQRIVDIYPDLALAENARRRLDIVGLELKAKGKSRAVPLGQYEQNIGLKRTV